MVSDLKLIFKSDDVLNHREFFLIKRKNVSVYVVKKEFVWKFFNFSRIYKNTSFGILSSGKKYIDIKEDYMKIIIRRRKIKLLKNG